MKMTNFTKMQGLGNDFIVLGGHERLPDDGADLAARLCDRHFGIGADGLVFVLPSERADYMMRIINSDGTEAEQCGNAIRCAAKYIYDKGLVERGRTNLTIETVGAGVQPVKLTLQEGRVTGVRVDMGPPVLHGLSVPTTVDAETVVEYPLTVDGRELRLTAVSMGNPHCVIFVEDAAGEDLYAWGPKLETHSLFPRKTNVEFVTVRSRTHADMRVWERGAGPTLACGTGACATLVAGVLTGVLDREAVVSLKGGDLSVEWNGEDNRVYMTGPAAFVFEGSF
ncbi:MULTISPECIES: diaminopimelate epimerase [Paenibacillus]|uniref:diaminopimelate epimerase n=1 Tax=Paenibacillus TaxID=44249 RepID=UPI0022B88969|nr:diaminopimelate epimerase [Paenibacillus caseinilyticus]MCZ8520210.1 diaminopimelate epimerase [Paenibacillus caseinilyticus]